MMSKSKKRKLRNNYKKSKEMDVSSIRFTQKSVNNTFSKGNPIEWTINMLKTGKIKPCEIPLIRVAKYNGYYKSIDNRRLYCFKKAAIKKIPVIINKITKEFQYKDQSPNNGVSVKIINDPKDESFDTQIVTAYHPITGNTRSWTVGEIKAMIDSTNNKKRRTRCKNRSNHQSTEPIQAKIQKSQRKQKSKSTKSVCTKTSIAVADDVAVSAKDNLDGNKVYHLNGKSYQKNVAKHNGNNQNGKIKLAASISNISGKINNNKKESLLVLVLIGFLIVAVKKGKI